MTLCEWKSNAADMQRLLTLQTKLRQASLGLACAMLFVIMLLGGADAIGSYFFNHPVPVVLELSEVLLAASVFMALASAGADGKHILVDVVTERMTPRCRALCTSLGWAVGLFIFTALTWQSWRLGIDSVTARETASALIRFPIWPAKLFAAVGLTLAALQCLGDLLLSIRGSVR